MKLQTNLTILFLATSIISMIVVLTVDRSIILISILTVLFMVALVAFFTAKSIGKLHEETIKLDNNNKFLDSIIENIPLMVFIKDARDLRFISFNKAGEELVGYTKAEILGKNDYDFFPKEQADFFTQKDRAVLSSTMQIDIPDEAIDTKFKGKKILHTRKIALRDSSGNPLYLLGISEDITSQKEREKELEKEKNISEKLVAIVRDANEPIIAKKLDGTITSWNHAAERMYGYLEKEVIGKSIKIIVPKDRYQEVDDILKIVGNGDFLDHFQTVRIKKDGSPIDVSIAASPIKNTEGKIVEISVVTLDITKEKQIDKTKTELIALASHQLRAPLSVINWYTEMLLSNDVGKVTVKQKKYLKMIDRSNKEMTELVSDFLNVSRLEFGTFISEPQTTDITKLTKSVVDEQKIKIREKKLNFELDIDKNIPVINTDPNLLRMILQNLLSNAVKYTPPKGKIIFSISINQDNNLALKISDTGYGIPKNQQDKLFTKLFRADNIKDKDTDGTGLGLYIVKLILENSGGKITFESEENKGSTFSVSLPIKLV